ncbi:isochorismatase family cysteine hydrolase [Paenibacillus sp. NPDC056722]|uniref:isochorismatase family cysteine hydrolase n=1 Tax=Paenibacillus sp. NPDC056722 TaxID=3345924 RepID=UPI0036815FE4
MTKLYDQTITGLLLVDPYNDFLSPEGKSFPRAKEVADSVNLLEHLKEIVNAVREAGIQVFFVPHHRSEPDDFENWLYPTPYQLGVKERQTFAKGSWGGEFHPDFQPQKGDVIIKEHWGSSGFANTDLDHQLKMHGVQKIIVVGLLANTCIEATARFGMELGYHVTLVKDATAAFSKEAMRVAHEINGPTFAHAILTTKELLAEM